MSEQDIDERRARVLLKAVTGVEHTSEDFISPNVMTIARAIRLSDEAAGYITAKLETLESAKERRS